MYITLRDASVLYTEDLSFHCRITSDRRTSHITYSAPFPTPKPTDSIQNASTAAPAQGALAYLSRVGVPAAGLLGV